MADAAYPAVVLETRKTAPGLRLVDKWAVYIFLLLILFLSMFYVMLLTLVFILLLGSNWWREQSQAWFI